MPEQVFSSSHRSVRFDPMPPLPTFFAYGACASSSHPSGQWDFDVEPETSQARTSRHFRAASVCEQCPVISQCGKFAEKDPFAKGVWGGVLFRPKGKPVNLVAQLRAYRARQSAA